MNFLTDFNQAFNKGSETLKFLDLGKKLKELDPKNLKMGEHFFIQIPEKPCKIFSQFFFKY